MYRMAASDRHFLHRNSPALDGAISGNYKTSGAGLVTNAHYTQSPSHGRDDLSFNRWNKIAMTAGILVQELVCHLLCGGKSINCESAFPNAVRGSALYRPQLFHSIFQVERGNQGKVSSKHRALRAPVCRRSSRITTGSGQEDDSRQAAIMPPTPDNNNGVSSSRFDKRCGSFNHAPDKPIAPVTEADATVSWLTRRYQCRLFLRIFTSAGISW